jgi:FkbM family methyltransferase
MTGGDRPGSKISYAQNGEDVRVWRAMRHLETPVYVDVGAHDPFEMSVTASLSALGWSGVLVEADPEMAARLRRARPRDVVVAAAAYDSPGVLRLHYTPKSGQAFVSGDETGDTIEVPAQKLDDILEAAGVGTIHFMTIDVEGAEAAVVRGCDLKRWRPWVLCIEATLPDSRTPAFGEWEPDVLAAGYLFAAFDGLNRWYVEAEHAELVETVAEPFSILDEGLDGWRRVAVAQLDEQNNTLRRQLDDERVLAERDIGRLRDERDSTHRRLVEVHDELKTVLGSHSWRVTSPMRGIRRVIRPGQLRRVVAAAAVAAHAGLSEHPVARARAAAALSRSPRVARVVRRLLASARAATLPAEASSFDAVAARRADAMSALADGARRRRQLA